MSVFTIKNNRKMPHYDSHYILLTVELSLWVGLQPRAARAEELRKSCNRI